MLEIEFEKEQLCDGVDMEWAIREFDGRFDLIVHYFLGQKRPVPEFFKALHDALIECVPHDLKVETAYTQEMDGHDVVVMGVTKWKVKPMVGFINKFTLARLSPDMWARLAAAPQEDGHGQDATEGAPTNAPAQGEAHQGKGAPVCLD